MSPAAAPQNRRRWLWPVLLAGAITALSAGPGLPRLPTGGWLGSDKVGHFFLFGLLATLVARCGPPQARWLAVAWLGAAGFGVADELHQSLNPHRDFDPADMVANLLGVSVAVAAWAALPGWRWLCEAGGRPQAGSRTVA